MNHINETRRRFLTTATSFLAGAGVVAATIPFVESWKPSARARAAGSPVTVDTAKIDIGSMITLEWQGKPVWILKRTNAQVAFLRQSSYREDLRDPDSSTNQQPDYAKNVFRSLRPDIFVAVGICTHLGCVPNYQPDGITEFHHGLYYCPCHGSKFDLAGRVFEGVPAPTNLIIPPHHYLNGDLVEIGIDENTSA